MSLLFSFVKITSFSCLLLSESSLCNLPSFLRFVSSRISFVENSTANARGLPEIWGSKKHKAVRKLKLLSMTNIDAETENQLAPFRARVKEQGDKVRQMKETGAPDLDLKREVQELKNRKKELEDMVLKLSESETFDRARMADLVKRRFFYDISFAIYGGITGQYDFGPMGCDLVDNILSVWHNHFVIHERMLKVNCSILTPEPVLKASGHVEKFADYMVKDSKTGECFRLDHLIKLHFEKFLADKKKTEEEKAEINRKIVLLDGLSMEEMNKIVKEYSMKSPSTGNDLTDAMEFNLMFPVSIGPSGTLKGFLRPETAQGIFVNFKRLLEYNLGKLPFACAQVGNSYRNEISPRSGLLRVREFTMAEIEHFCYPDDKAHPRFDEVADLEVTLYSACDQMDGCSAKTITIGEAVHGTGLDTLGKLKAELGALNRYLRDQSYIFGHSPTDADVAVLCTVKLPIPDDLHHVKRWYGHMKSYVLTEVEDFGRVISSEDTKAASKKVIANETLGYYMARVHQFLVKIGIDPKKLRFRQHLGNEMAHYACDCWDAECLTSYGWIECVGCADRSAYDLTQHTRATGVRLGVERQLAEPKVVNAVTPVIDKGVLGKSLKKDSKQVQDILAALSSEEVQTMDDELNKSGEYKLPGGFVVTREMIPSVKNEEKKVHTEEIIPSVIEPSFGIGRIFYSLLEHSFRVREDDDKRTYFALPAIVAPVKVCVLPLSAKQEFMPFCLQIVNAITERGLSVRIDDSSGSIGRRYARTDEIAVPFAVTVDFDTVNNVPHTVTLRERDSTLQVRMPIEEVSDSVLNLSKGKISWPEVMTAWPRFIAQETGK